MLSSLNRAIGRRLAHFLSKQVAGYQGFDAIPIDEIATAFKPGDILLVDGNSRISEAIKYLTQSSWSHACLHVGSGSESIDQPIMLEADLEHGVHLVPVTKYADCNVRICRPVDVSEEDNKSLIEFARSKLGYRYDLKNIIDLLRYIIQNPAVPTRYRRTLISLGSGEPTKAICSTLIAQSFQHIDYPILPVRGNEGDADDGLVPTYYKRHFTHFTPRDFDVSPYFRIIKPTIEKGFDYRTLQWVKPTLLDEMPQGQE